MSAGVADADKTRLRGINPYWRLAYNHEWGAHSLMVGTSGMNAVVYENPLDISDEGSTFRYRDLAIDAQYQYLLDPHSVTAQFAYSSNHVRYPTDLALQPVLDPSGNALAETNLSDSTRLLRTKLTYVYRATYGGSLGFFDLSGGTNTANLSNNAGPSAGQPDGNISGSPATRGYTLEAFWTPIQYLRIGAQYTAYSKFNGASTNYDGFGRNASDNNTLFVYTWLAY
jgi:hypothetical protein